MQETKTVKKKNKVGGFTLPDYKTILQSYRNQQCGVGIKRDKYINAVE